MPFTEVEALLILCFYKIDKARNMWGFLTRFNDYFGKDLGEQTLEYELSIIKSAEESANMPATDQRIYYRELWTKYSSGNRFNDTKAFYLGFKNGKFSAKWEEPPVLRSSVIKPIIDEPVQKPGEHESRTQLQQRSALVKLQALKSANYQCECSCGRTLFQRRDGQHTYTEGHHLIPMRFQSEFDFSIDVPANVVSLCPSCHRQLHYGKDLEGLLENLWSLRKDRLMNCGIYISFPNLLLMYR